MAAGRDHRSEQARRDQLARQRGFRNRSEQRRFSRHVRNRRDLERLPQEAQIRRSEALVALTHMRRDPRLTLAEAAHQVGTTPDVVRWYAGEALVRVQGNWQVRAGDRLYRRMYVHSGGQTVAVGVRGSQKASALSDYHQAVGIFLETGDESLLRRFASKSIAGLPFETNPDVLEEMARRGHLDVDSIYQLVA
jgi:hypothetical protein